MEPSAIATRSARDELHEQGYALLPAVYAQDELVALRAALDAATPADADVDGPFGHILHPLLAHAPALGPALVEGGGACVLAALAEIFPRGFRLTHTGGLISGGARPFTPWHCHVPQLMDDPAIWDLHRRQRGRGIRRALTLTYVDGSLPALGTLVVIPRRADDPLAPPALERTGPWPGQRAIVAPPGSVVILDSQVFHAALPAAGHGRRRIFGGHWQDAEDPTAHREDQAMPWPENPSLSAAVRHLRARVLGRMAG
jgi:hypothetical protein